MIHWMKDYVAIRAAKHDESDGGVLLPQDINDPKKGEVCGFGPRVKEFRVGDKVLFPRYVGQKVIFDEEEFLIMSDYHILGFV